MGLYVNHLEPIDKHVHTPAPSKTTPDSKITEQFSVIRASRDINFLQI